MLITKRFELLMFTQVVTPEVSFSLSATAETKAVVVVILSKSLPRWATVVRDYKQVL